LFAESIKGYAQATEKFITVKFVLISFIDQANLYSFGLSPFSQFSQACDLSSINFMLIIIILIMQYLIFYI